MSSTAKSLLSLLLLCHGYVAWATDCVTIDGNTNVVIAPLLLRQGQVTNTHPTITPATLQLTAAPNSNLQIQLPTSVILGNAQGGQLVLQDFVWQGDGLVSQSGVNSQWVFPPTGMLNIQLTGTVQINGSTEYTSGVYSTNIPLQYQCIIDNATVIQDDSRIQALTQAATVITVTEQAPLDFQTITLNRTSFNVTVPANSGQAARFEVTGEPGAYVQMQLSNGSGNLQEIYLTGSQGGPNLLVDGLNYNGADINGNAQLDPQGQVTIQIGGTLHIPANAVPGIYEGSAQVIVSYL